MSGNPAFSTDALLRARLIASGRLRPNTNELEPVQLPPGTIVFRVLDSTRYLFGVGALQ